MSMRGPGLLLSVLVVALAAGREGGEGRLESLLKGVDLTAKLFKSILVRYGVERIPAEGEPFDPDVHEAILQEESPDVAVDTVVEVEAGYRMRGKVLRPARVKVLKPPRPEPVPEPAEEVEEAGEAEAVEGDKEEETDG